MRVLAATDDGLSPFTVALLLTVVLLFVRYLYLRSQRSSDSSPRTLLPAVTESAPASPQVSPRSWWLWRTRRQRLEEETLVVLAHRDYILARVEQAKAMGGLVRARAELAEILASLRNDPSAFVGDEAHPPRTTSALTLQEIEEIVAAFPDISPQLRSALLQLLAGRLAEKVAQ